MKKLEQVYTFQTDIVAQTAKLYCQPGFDWKQALDELAENSDKLKDWSLVEK